MCPARFFGPTFPKVLDLADWKVKDGRTAAAPVWIPTCLLYKSSGFVPCFLLAQDEFVSTDASLRDGDPLLEEDLIPGLDFYINPTGRLVYTEFFLRKRGYCCGLGCLHCPYGYEGVRGTKPEPEEEQTPPGEASPGGGS